MAILAHKRFFGLLYRVLLPGTSGRRARSENATQRIRLNSTAFADTLLAALGLEEREVYLMVQQIYTVFKYIST
jgi:hypothetical protein